MVVCIQIYGMPTQSPLWHKIFFVWNKHLKVLSDQLDSYAVNIGATEEQQEHTLKKRRHCADIQLSRRKTRPWTCYVVSKCFKSPAMDIKVIHPWLCILQIREKVQNYLELLTLDKGKCTVSYFHDNTIQYSHHWWNIQEMKIEWLIGTEYITLRKLVDQWVGDLSSSPSHNNPDCIRLENYSKRKEWILVSTIQYSYKVIISCYENNLIDQELREWGHEPQSEWMTWIFLIHVPAPENFYHRTSYPSVKKNVYLLLIFIN